MRFTALTKNRQRWAWGAALGALFILVAGVGIRALSCKESPRSTMGPLVREPAVAGAFYPADAEELRRTVRGYLAAAKPQAPAPLKDQRPLALIVPHAGYLYSGQTAAFAYKLLEGKERPARVILLGPSHVAPLRDILVLPSFSPYRTPLGLVEVDEASWNPVDPSVFVRMPLAEKPEHSLEVQLPFLQVLWEAPPRIMPLIMGELRGEPLTKAADALRGFIDDKTLVIVSSDFTHYGPRFGFTPFKSARGRQLADRIRQLDMGAVEHIKKLDAEGLIRYCDETGATICGKVPIALLLKMLSGMPQVRGVSLHYASSAEVTGDYSDSVSYYAHAFYRAPAAGAK